MRSLDSRKYFVIGILLIGATLAVHGASPKSTAVVKGVSLSRTGGALEVKTSIIGR